MCIRDAKELADRLNFTYEVHVLSNTSIDDLVGEVANGVYDMGASRIAIKEQRTTYATFSFPYYTDGMLFIYRPYTHSGVSVSFQHFLGSLCSRCSGLDACDMLSFVFRSA